MDDYEEREAEQEVKVDQLKKEDNKTKPELTPKQKLLQVVKFAIFSCGAGIIQTVVYTLCTELIFKNSDRLEWLSYTIALVCSVIFNFTLNRKYTFKSASNVPKAMLLVGLFYCAFAPYSIWLTDYLNVNQGWNEYLVLFIVMIQNLTFEFLWDRFVVFRKSINTQLNNKKKDVGAKDTETQTSNLEKEEDKVIQDNEDTNSD